jgi:hypothetical protein
MIMTREQMIAYWVQNEPELPPDDGCFYLNRVCFPSLDNLTAEERYALADLISRHPEYLEREIVCDTTVN